MPEVFVRPELINPGDIVIDDHKYWEVKSCEIDEHETCDLYLVDKDGNSVHKIVTEPICVIV